MGVLLFILIVIACLFFRKSYFIYALSFLFMWITFGWNTKNPDRNIYRYRFDAYNGWLEDVTEPLYTLAMKYFHLLGVTFQESYIIISFLFLVALFYYIYSTCRNRNFVIAAILVSTYCMFITLFRTTFASIFALLAILVLLYSNYNKIVKTVLYILLISIASFIHSLYLLYLPLVSVLWVERDKLVKIVFCSIVLCVLFVGAISTNLLPDIMGFMHMEGKEDMFLGDTDNGDGNKVIQYLLSVLRCLSVLVIPFGIKFLDKEIRFNNIENFILNINIIFLAVLPLLFISHDLYRIFYVISIVNFCMLSNHLYKRKIFFFSMFCSINIGYWFYIRPYFEETFWDIFTNNLILD